MLSLVKDANTVNQQVLVHIDVLIFLTKHNFNRMVRHATLTLNVKMVYFVNLNV